MVLEYCFSPKDFPNEHKEFHKIFYRGLKRMTDLQPFLEQLLRGSSLKINIISYE